MSSAATTTATESAAAAAATADRAARFYVPVEQFYCIGCDSLIPSDHVVANVRKPRSLVEPTRRDVRALCPHCNRGWHGSFVLGGGVWQIERAPAEIDEPAPLASLRARIDHNLGVIQQRDRDHDAKPGRRLRKAIAASPASG